MARRAEKKQATRERLIAAAADLFCQQGFDRTTVDEIVAIAGVSQRTFFRYFPSKLEVAFPNEDEARHLLQDLLRKHLSREAPMRGVRDALMEYSQWFVGERETLLREWQYISASPALIARDSENDRENERLIADTLAAAGLPRRRSNLLAGIVHGGIRASVVEWFNDGCQEELLTVARDLAILLGRLDETLVPLPGPLPDSLPPPGKGKTKAGTPAAKHHASTRARRRPKKDTPRTR